MKNFSVSHIFSLNGTIGRVEYIVTICILTILYYALDYLIPFVFDTVFKVKPIDYYDHDAYYVFPISGLVEIVFTMYLIGMLFCQGVKRCHDLGHNGLCQLIPFYFIVMLFSKGNTGENNRDLDSVAYDEEKTNDTSY